MKWSNIYETITYIAEHLLNYKDWDHLDFQAPILAEIPLDCYLSDEIPFCEALFTVADPNISDMGTYNIYLDDIIVIKPYLPGNQDGERGATTLAIHTVGHPISRNENVTRKYLVSKSKPQAEAALTDLLIMLRCLLDTRSLIIKLSSHKW